MKPTVGRIVHFVNNYGVGREIVPAIITQVWSETCVNLRVFYDGTNHAPKSAEDWVTSVTYDDRETPDPRTWHWPPRN